MEHSGADKSLQGIERPSAAARAKSILIVDRDPQVLDALDRVLTRSGYHVATALDFAHAKHSMADRAPDVLMTEVRLGEFNGLQLVLLGKAASPTMAAFVFSRTDDPVLRQEAARFGAEYVLKPLDPAALLHALSGH